MVESARWAMAGLVVAGAMLPPMCLAAELPGLAVADFDFADTSGEATNQRDAHDRRVHGFVAALRTDIARAGAFRVVPLQCGAAACSADRLSADALTAGARRDGARFLLLGGFHKVSSLILNGTVLMVDLNADRVVLNRALTFRGDTDESWQKMESFVAAQVVAVQPATAPRTAKPQ